jgi:flagellar hook protein FlgE
MAQVGSGAMLSSVDSVFGQGTFESTTSETDLAIKGNGLFIVKNPDTGGDYYTRAGAFRVQDGKLTNPEGYIVQGEDLQGAPDVMVDVSLDINSEELPGWTSPDPADTSLTAPTLESVSVDTDGVVIGKYTDGSTFDLFTVGIAKFNNPSGLVKEGNSMYTASTASGPAVPGTVQELGGAIYSSTLEMSNVDIAQEFVKMITTQRGFQANSKIITTTDELLNEVINMKR